MKRIKMEVPYFQVPNDIFEIGLDKHQLVVYMYVARCGNQWSKAFPIYQTISDKCWMSNRKAISTVKELVEMRLIYKETRYNVEVGENYSNIYYVETNIKGGAHHAPGSEYNALCSEQGAPYKELGYKEIDNKYIHLPQEDEYVSFYLETFTYHLGKEHMRVKESDYSYILDEIGSIREEGITYEDWQEAVEEHFETLPKRNNGNILAFLKAKKRYFDV